MTEKRMTLRLDQCSARLRRKWPRRNLGPRLSRLEQTCVRPIILSIEISAVGLTHPMGLVPRHHAAQPHAPGARPARQEISHNETPSYYIRFTDIY